MAADLLRAGAFIFAAQAIIMCGIYFISGLLLPKMLAGIYGATGYPARLLIALVAAFSVGNLMMAYVFAQFPPSIAAPLTIFAIVILQVIFAVLCFGIRPSPWIYPATLAVALSCVWVSSMLVAKPPL